MSVRAAAHTRLCTAPPQVCICSQRCRLSACRNHELRNEAIWDAAPECAGPRTICRAALDTGSANQRGGQRSEIVALQAVACRVVWCGVVRLV